MGKPESYIWICCDSCQIYLHRNTKLPNEYRIQGGWQAGVYQTYVLERHSLAKVKGENRGWGWRSAQVYPGAKMSGKCFIGCGEFCVQYATVREDIHIVLFPNLKCFQIPNRSFAELVHMPIFTLEFHRVLGYSSSRAPASI